MVQNTGVHRFVEAGQGDDMTERVFRLFLGVSLLIILFFEWTPLLYVYIVMIAVEGLTNWRIPNLISKLRYPDSYREPAANAPRTYKYNFETERVFRLVIAAFLIVSCFVFPKTLWFFPWAVGFGLSMAGITGICPIAITCKKLGFR